MISFLKTALIHTLVVPAMLWLFEAKQLKINEKMILYSGVFLIFDDTICIYFDSICNNRQLHMTSQKCIKHNV